MRRQLLCSRMSLFLAALLSLLLWTMPVCAAEPVEVDAERVKELMDADQATVIFPLSPIEFNNLHIRDSVNIPIAEVPAALPADKSRPLVFYCLGRT
ncbi:MAG TPA: rhodanese-like domain-containing protein [Desulfuromonadales bacterium]|nr:rhodanese-like domain-containing protein [Desulfuromonadales bacterium]